MSDPELKHNETESPEFDRKLWDLAWRIYHKYEKSERKIVEEEGDLDDYPPGPVVDDTWVDGFMCGWLTRGAGERPANAQA